MAASPPGGCLVSYPWVQENSGVWPSAVRSRLESGAPPPFHVPSPPASPAALSRLTGSRLAPAGPLRHPLPGGGGWRRPHGAPTLPRLESPSVRRCVCRPTPPGVDPCDRGHATVGETGGVGGRGAPTVQPRRFFFLFPLFFFFAPFHRRPACPCSRHPRLAPQLRARTCPAHVPTVAGVRNAAAQHQHPAVVDGVPLPPCPRFDTAAASAAGVNGGGGGRWAPPLPPRLAPLGAVAATDAPLCREASVFARWLHILVTACFPPDHMRLTLPTPLLPGRAPPTNGAARWTKRPARRRGRPPFPPAPPTAQVPPARVRHAGVGRGARRCATALRLSARRRSGGGTAGGEVRAAGGGFHERGGDGGRGVGGGGGWPAVARRGGLCTCV